MERGPIPEEHLEIARGSGAAAVLLFLHIAVVGYLGFCIYYLLRHGMEVAWTLTHLSAALFYYLPAGFALFTRLPTDPLTDKVGLVALITGCITWAVYGTLLGEMLFTPHPGMGGWWKTCAAIGIGLLGAAALRLGFEALTGAARGNYKKNHTGK